MKYFIPLLFFVVPICSYGQGSVGLVHYGEIQSMGLGAPVGPDYNALLAFDDKNSLYITRQDSLEGGHIYENKRYQTASGTSHSQTNSTNKEGFLFFNDRNGKQFYSRDAGFRYVKEALPEINWKIKTEKKKIGGFTATKAVARFRGRDYTAWFTTEIPLPYGPWKLQGLPGMILEAYDTHKEIYWYFKTLEHPTEKAYMLKPIEATKDWISLNDHRDELMTSLKNSRVAGRIGAESAGISVGNDEGIDILRFYIENFKEDGGSNQ